MSSCSSCHCGDEISEKPAGVQRFELFNWVTALLLTGWVGIVSLAMHVTGAGKISAVPTLEAFLRTLL